MAENSLQNQKNEASFVLSEKAKAIIEKFEEKLHAGKYTAEQKNGIRAELVWQLLARQYPETICKVEEIMAAAESEKHNVESPLKGLEGLVSQFGESLPLAMGLIDLHTIRLQIPICDLVDDEQIEVLSKETPAIVDHYFYVIVKYVVFKDSNDIYRELCINLSSEVRAIRVLFIKDSIDLETNLRSSQYPLYWILWFFKFKNNNSTFSVSNNKFDLIIIDENEDISKDSTFKHNGITCFLQEIVSKHLSDTGYLFYRSSAESINDDSLLAFRKWIVENKLLHGVIGIYSEQVMILRKQHADAIFFVNATDDCFWSESHWNVDKLLEVINTKDRQYYKEVSFEEFASYNSKFSTFAKRQLAPSVIANEGETVVTIGDLVDLYESETMEDVSCFFLNRPYYFENGYYEPIEAVTTPLARRIPNDEFFLFKWDMLSQKFLCSYLDSIEISIEIRNSPRRFMYDDFYDSENNPIICTYPDAIVFTLKDKPIVPVYPEYLAKMFSSDMVIQQMDYFREYHSSIESDYYPDLASYFIDNEGFLSIKLAIPSLNEQLQMLDMWHKETYLNTKKEIQKNFESYKQDIRMKKHALTQRLATMDNWWKILLEARKNGNGIVDDEATVGHSHPIPVRNIYTQIDQEIKILSKQLQSFTLGDTMDREEIFDAAAFVREYIKHHDPMFEYQCELPDKPANIRFPHEAFDKIMNNIVFNACSHGFKGKEIGENIIQVMMEIKGHDLIVCVSNNGKPMPVKMTAEKVFTYGDTTEEGVGEHSGLGGFEIKDLITKFGGEVELLLDAEAEFPVTYKLIFRDVNIYK